ncbi:hypothetical protein [Holdemania massiliensis]|uniref:DUF4276 family protein n=1 Tax=Holdemania massiliensis TaxID=1468449 RepID=A0A6N7S8X9_9FIRM|nr:hypothetical protein [Holdemania massiliensis]MSA71838.1 hypothetical protein [Holdemania massiliensis]MSA90112.1 hypothetical protein [Holdemania massiliensis]MSB78918.1 hypothetical protein [Holdemania massiliensis]MSC33842.1 hypothetical protein [Holdemania massiliensis]MSC40232.1 hypothetical protein [Holdemania massiliensis]
MAEKKRKILVLVEGAKTDVALMERLFSIYQIDFKYEIVSYCTNIYTLYKEMFEDNDPDDMDLLQLLKSREPDLVKKTLFDESYSDILLIFDLDPHDFGFNPEKIRHMAKYFVESSDVGKLYINYPMVEAFYHMTSIPDLNFNTYNATLNELSAGTYKARVNRENRNHDYRKFAATKEECNIVIRQNISKAWLVVGDPEDDMPPSQAEILNTQLNSIQNENRVAVLSTCAFFIPEYNLKLIR